MANPEKQKQEKKDDGQQLVVRKEPTEIARPERTSALRREPFEPFEIMRDLMRWHPFRDFFLTRDPFREMRDLMRDFWETRPARRESAWYPAFEVRETDDEYLITGDVPGLATEDLDVSVTGNRVQVSGKREQKEEQTEGDYRTYERAYGSFTRVFEIPDDVDADKIACKLDAGVLELALPKKPESKPAKRRIEVKSGGEKH